MRVVFYLTSEKGEDYTNIIVTRTMIQRVGYHDWYRKVKAHGEKRQAHKDYFDNSWCSACCFCHCFLCPNQSFYEGIF